MAQLEQALRLAPDNAEAHNNLGHAQQLQGRTARSDRPLPRGGPPGARNDLVHLNLGNALQDIGEMEESIVHLEKAIELNPSAADAHNNLGVALGSVGRVEEAISHFEAALAIHPTTRTRKTISTMALTVEELKGAARRAHRGHGDLERL